MKETLLKLAALSLILTYFVIILGGATRVWDAGMSCPDWPKCYGLWWPFPESRVFAFEPTGYTVDGIHYTLGQVLLEWGHRLLAAILGGVILLQTILSFYTKQARWLAILALLVLFVQVKLGGVTVWLNNVPWSVAIHLGNAMLLFAILVWWHRVLKIGDATPKAPIIPNLAILGFVGFAILTFITMAVGATLSSAHGGGVCGGLFSCGGQWWPVDGLQQVHMLHRFLALGVVALSVFLLIYCKRQAPELRKTALGLHILMWGQVAWGIATLYSFQYYPDLYRPLSVAHLGWGTLLWLGSVGALLRLRYGSAGSHHG